MPEHACSALKTHITKMMPYGDDNNLIADKGAYNRKRSRSPRRDQVNGRENCTYDKRSSVEIMSRNCEEVTCSGCTKTQPEILQ